MSPYFARPSVVSFPPAALPALIGTIRRSDSLPLILPPSLSAVVRHTLRDYPTSYRGVVLSPKADAGSPGLPCSLAVTHAMVSDPEEAALPCLCGRARVDFRGLVLVVLPGSGITGLSPFNLSAYGLRAC